MYASNIVLNSSSKLLLVPVKIPAGFSDVAALADFSALKSFVVSTAFCRS